MSNFAAIIVYLLCAVTSGLACAVLAIQYHRTGFRLLFWSASCFLGLTLNNAMLFLDIVVFPDADLSVLRTLPAVLGFAALLYGFIWETT